MGYTHYFQFNRRKAEIPDFDEKFDKAVALINEKFKLLPKTIDVNGKVRHLILKDACRAKEPIITSEVISINGNGYEGCEGFYIPCDIDRLEKQPCLKFCKTRCLPYDLAICVAILCLKEAFGEDFDYSSDGDIESGEYYWGEAKEIMAHPTE